MNESYRTVASSIIGFLAGAALTAAVYRVLDHKEKKDQQKALDSFMEAMVPPAMFGNMPFLPLTDEPEGPPPFYVVQLVSPEGNRLDVAFSPEEWDILHALCEMSGEPFEKVLIDVVMERRDNGTL